MKSQPGQRNTSRRAVKTKRVFAVFSPSAAPGQKIMIIARLTSARRGGWRRWKTRASGEIHVCLSVTPR
eukprot:14623219-Alexandrium_andersonii.AAC.1